MTPAARNSREIPDNTRSQRVHRRSLAPFRGAPHYRKRNRLGLSQTPREPNRLEEDLGGVQTNAANTLVIVHAKKRSAGGAEGARRNRSTNWTGMEWRHYMFLDAGDDFTPVLRRTTGRSVRPLGMNSLARERSPESPFQRN